MTQTTPSPRAGTKAAERAATATDDAKLSRSLGVGGNVLITLSGISPASSVFILGGAALATYGTGVFWGFVIAGVISLLIAFCYAELASRHPLAGGDYSLVSRDPRTGRRCRRLLRRPHHAAAHRRRVRTGRRRLPRRRDRRTRPGDHRRHRRGDRDRDGMPEHPHQRLGHRRVPGRRNGRAGPAHRARPDPRRASDHRAVRSAGDRRRDRRARPARHRRPGHRGDPGHLLVQRLQRRRLLR